MHRVRLPAHLRSKAMRREANRESGIALILVIWVVTLLLVLASSFLYATRVDARAMRNAALLARADAIVQAALARAAIELQKPPASPGVWRRDPAVRDWSFDGVSVRLSVTDESGKIDLNSANNALLANALRAAGLEGEEAAKLLDAILDWRDADSLRRPNGAEEREYAEAGLPGRPANQPFQSVEELQLVLGIGPQTFQRMAPMLTIYSRLPGVNPYYASRSVLLAVPGATDEAVDAYLAERDAAFAANRQPPVFAAAGAFASYAPVSPVTVNVEVRLEEGLTVNREAVLLVTPQFPRRPLALLAWREGRVAPTSTTENASGR